ncbi:MAG TPA: xanthine dehydrogenase family protein molybdopterin-binding subunit [Candidatus Binatia bacterium]|nr:xanthine dehydrogenase family protein molybdopterin-binding subunit [Candidatus Binatia bacterium]
MTGGGADAGAIRPGRYVGRSVRRVEDRRLLTGCGRFLDDIRLEGTVHAAFARSPHAHARVEAIDVAAAAVAPGVRAVLTAADLAAVPPLRSDPMAVDLCRVTEWPVLAGDTVRFVGEAVAVVVADGAGSAEDGVDLVAVEWAPLPAVTGIDDALRPGAEIVHAGWPDNVLMRTAGGGGDPAGAFAGAPVVMAETFRSEPVTGVPMEPRGCLAWRDPSTDVLTVWSSHQTPHVLRSLLAEALAYPEHLVRVIVPDLGGGFGIKTHLYPEELVVAALALRLGRPVKWVQTRREDLACNNYCRDHEIAVELAADADGHLRGLRVRIRMNAGAYALVPGFGAILEATGAARQILGPYRVGHYGYEAEVVVSHRVPRGAYRGVAMVTTTFSMERVMDLLAARVGLDPAEVRRRNLITAGEFPYRNALGIQYEPASFVECLEAGLAALDYAGARAEQARARAGGRLLGVGLATYAEFTAPSARALAWRGIVRVPGFDSTTIRVEPSGTVRAYSSLTAMGQGIETALAQLIAEELGVAIEDVSVGFGDSSLSPYGSGAFASRGAVVGGGATILAARRLRAKILAIAARALEAEPADLVLGEGRIAVRGAAFRSVALADVTRQAYMVGPVALPEGMEPGLEETVYHDPPIQSISNGAHLILAEVDPATGGVRVLRHVVVHDCGTVINPMIVDGQIHGGIAQGLGQALSERAAYDEAGQLLTGSLMDYPLPRADDLPHLEVAHLETPSTLTVGGMKGMGEGGTIGAVAAIANAVADALGPAGAAVTRLPLLPERVRAALATR